MKYAKDTSVSSDQTRTEIERILRRYGASEFAYAWKNQNAMIAFKIQERYIRFMLPMPDANSEEFQYTPARRYLRTPEQAYAAWEQACRQRWRALALLIKAKLEAVEAGIITFEEEFMPKTVLPNGQTVSEYILPQIAMAYEKNIMPALLPGIGGE